MNRWEWRVISSFSQKSNSLVSWTDSWRGNLQCNKLSSLEKRERVNTFNTITKTLTLLKLSPTMKHGSPGCVFAVPSCFGARRKA